MGIMGLLFWVNYNNLTSSPRWTEGIEVTIPIPALFQASDFLQFSQMIRMIWRYHLTSETSICLKDKPVKEIERERERERGSERESLLGFMIRFTAFPPSSTSLSDKDKKNQSPTYGKFNA